MARLAILALIGLLTPACTSFSGDPHVFVSSTPAGAEIFVDGTPTGFTTPSMLDLGGFWSGDHDITLRMAGREPETRRIHHHSTTQASRWNDGADTAVLGVTVPLWWTLGDWFLPFAVRWRFTPHEIHMVLYEEGKAPFRAADS